jgi:undecaprenyl diphosphate synthase
MTTIPSLPQCVGFIMDGNRRWAKAQGKAPIEGHTAGYETLLRMVEVVHRVGIPHMVCYAFSTENWNRSEEEVSHLMKLLQRGVNELEIALKKNGRKGNVRIIGERSLLSEAMLRDIERVESGNIDAPELTVWLAISYDGRAEIVAATNAAVAQGTVVTEETFRRLLYTADMPDPDLIVRTSGELRISNFLLFQSAYSEYFFTDTLWPDFGESEFRAIVEAYGTRQRRTGR